MKTIRVQVFDDATGTVDLWCDVLMVEAPIEPVSLLWVSMVILGGQHAAAHVEQAVVSMGETQGMPHERYFKSLHERDGLAW